MPQTKVEKIYCPDCKKYIYPVRYNKAQLRCKCGKFLGYREGYGKNARVFDENTLTDARAKYKAHMTEMENLYGIKKNVSACA